MGIFDFNFNFGNKQTSIKELDSSELEDAKFKARIAIIDDEEVPNIDNLLNDGYNVIKYSDLENVDEFIRKKHNVLILDIQGVGEKIAGKRGGWGILDYLKKEYPHLVIIIFTGADWSITKYKEVADMADFIIGKDAEYLDFKMKLDAAIRRSFSFKFHLEVFTKEIEKTNKDQQKIIELINKYGKDKSKTLKKIRKVTTNEFTLQKVDNLLSIISSIYSIIPS